MNDPLQKILFELAARFRLAILGSLPSACPLATLQDFPRGACRDASLLLAKYLQVNNCGSAFYVLGERQGQDHAWLQLGGLTIDITADQFADQDAAVMVTSDSSWHSSFNGKIHNVADFCLYDPHSAFQLTRAYEAITGLCAGSYAAMDRHQLPALIAPCEGIEPCSTERPGERIFNPGIIVIDVRERPHAAGPDRGRPAAEDAVPFLA